jgi:hypothetical protein
MKKETKKKRRTPRRLIITFHVMAILFFTYHFALRPRFLDWGASESLRETSFPGDSFTRGAHHTRAVLIDATPEQLWPWLNQIGQDRGGFYSYQWLENIFAADITNVHDIKPEFQWPRQLGDTVWLANKDHYNGKGYQIIAEITPFKSMVMVGGDDYARVLSGEEVSGSWAFYLYPETSEKTWLVARSSDGDLSWPTRLARYTTFEIPHYIMERKMLRSIKKLAEENPVDHVELRSMNP